MSSADSTRALRSEQREGQSSVQGGRFEVQSLSLSKDRFGSEDAATQWAEQSGFRVIEVHESPEAWVIPQRSRAEFGRDSLRSFELEQGVTAFGGVVAEPEPESTPTDCMRVEPLFAARTHGEGRKVSLRAKLPQIDRGHTAWMHIAFEGEWQGHHSGPFQFTREVFETAIKNFDAQKNNVPLYFEHDFVPGQPRPTAGWIFDLKITDCDEHGCELWGHVSFTDNAAEMIKAGEYQFCSIVIDFESEDRKTAEPIGPELLEVGLTDSPFLDSQHSLQLSRRAAAQSNSNTDSPRRSSRRRSLSMPSLQDLIAEAREVVGDEATPDQFKRALDAVIAKYKSVQGDAPPGDEEQTEASATPSDDATQAAAEPSEEATAAAQEPAESAPSGEGEGESRQLAMDEAITAQLEGELMAIAEALGTDTADVVARLGEMRDQVAQVLSGGAEDGTAAEEQAAEGFSREARDAALARVSDMQKQLKAKDGEVKKLSDRIKQLEDDKLQKRVEDAIHAGQISEANKDKYLKLGRKNPELLDEFLADAQKAPEVPTGRNYTPPPSNREEDDGSDIDPKLLDAQVRALMNVGRYRKRSDAKARAVQLIRQRQANA